MKSILLISTVLGGFCQHVHAQAVFAHFMVSNTPNFTITTWQYNFNLAKESKIDAFTMNVGFGDPSNEQRLTDAFTAATQVGFKLLLNFDYATGSGLWPLENVTALILRHRNSPAYFKHNGQPLVSTFEGAARASDWTTIKQQTGAFFMPSWTSLTPKESLAKGVADGLSNWEAWPAGGTEMYSSLDSTYQAELTLTKKLYIMPISPWFYANMPKYNKNWVWRGESVWFDRWNQVLYHRPSAVQIISWNDFGESHYIGPLDTNQYAAFAADHGGSPFNYADGVPHDGWRKFLPFLSDMYKQKTATITRETVVAWYRRTPAALSTCNTGGTTGNTAAKLQLTTTPGAVLLDRIYFSALLGSPADVTVQIGGVQVPATWETENLPVGGAGIYHGHTLFTGRSGAVVVSIRRPAGLVIQLVGQPILTACPGTGAYQNYNAWVGWKDSTAVISSKTPVYTHCVEGSGPGRYRDVCVDACKLGYCPPVCTCLRVGPKPALPAYTGENACPADGYDESFLGLCKHNCELGKCNLTVCVKKPVGFVCPLSKVVPPVANVCKAGTGLGDWAALCAFACKYNNCAELCTCTQATVPPATATPGIIAGQSGFYPGVPGADYKLCEWACARGTCPFPCTKNVKKREETVHSHGHLAYHAGLHEK